MTGIESKVYSKFALAAAMALGATVGAGTANAAVTAAPTATAPPVWYATSVATMAAGATATPVPPQAGWPFLTPQHRPHGGKTGHIR